MVFVFPVMFMEGARGWSKTRHSKQCVTGIMRIAAINVLYRRITEECKVIEGCRLLSMTKVEYI